MSGQEGNVRQWRKLSEVTEKPMRVKSVAVVIAFGLVGRGRPVSSWLVSSLCPFGCAKMIHTFMVEVGYFPIFPHVSYCVVADRNFSVIIPVGLLDEARAAVSS